MMQTHKLDMDENLLNKVDNVCKFAIWAGDQLTNFKFCDESFPEHSKKEEKDWDFNDVPYYNYIYHRYRCIHPAFLAFINSTPTYKNDILTRLKNKYHGTVDLDCIEIATYLSDSFIPDNRRLNEYLSETEYERVIKIINSISKISAWKKQNILF